MIYLFHSIDFVLFFVLVFAAYWILPNKFKNIALLLASYLFYISWNWKFLGLILASTLVNYLCGLVIYNSKHPHSRKLYLLLSILTDLSLLGFFKYYNFFTQNIIELLNSAGLHLNLTTLSIILPLGISFYTFETMSYVIDIYRKKFAPTENIIDFALFVGYFPKLISGPIERAKKLIPMIQAEKHFKNINFKEGAYLFVYGLFKKVVIADSLANLVNATFALQNPSGSQVLIAAYAFAIQLYCDFSGYTDMAKGISHFFGIQLSANFNLPYFAKNPSDFWKRWNITLSSWVKDYVYIPLGGNKSKYFGMFPLFVAWLIMGLWHGASWNFISWGVYWYCAILAYRIIKSLIKFHIKNVFGIILMFHVTCFGWIIFRVQSPEQLITFTKALISGFDFAGIINFSYLYLYAIILFMIIYEILQYYQDNQLFIYSKNFYYQLAFYMVLFFMYIEIGAISNSSFIYFQF